MTDEQPTGGQPTGGWQADDPGAPPPGLALTATEWAVWQAFRNGSPLDVSGGRQDRGTRGTVWGPERSVRARVLALLLLHGPPPRLGRVAALHLSGAYVTERLDLSGGTVEAYFELRDCHFAQEVRMAEARIRTARFTDCHLPRLEARRVRIEGDLHLVGCAVPGGIRLTGASIGTHLTLGDAVVGHHDGEAIAAGGLTIGQQLRASRLTATGAVRLAGATVGGSLHLQGASLSCPPPEDGTGEEHGLHAPQLTVGQAAHLSVGPGPGGGDLLPFTCRGSLVLDDARIGGDLRIDGAELTMEGEQRVSLRRLQTPELRFTPAGVRGGRVSLSGAAVEKLVDRPGAWPPDGRLSMAGFTYRRLEPRAPFPLAQRLAWLAAAKSAFSLDAYEQLAAVYRNSGEEASARAVLLAKQRRRRATLGPAAKAWGHVQDWAVAYGYRPGRAALWMACLWALGTLVFAGHRPAPLKADEAPHWNPVLYALDLLLPVVTFGQEAAWRPAGAYQWAAAALVVLGWTLATTVAAGATRLLRRQ